MANNFQSGTAYGRRLASDAASQRADFWKKTILPIAAFATGGAALGAVGGGGVAAPVAAHGVSSASMGAGGGYGSLFAGNGAFLGGAAAPAAHAAVPAVSAAASTASRMPLWAGIGGKATDTLFGIYANKKQQQGNREALAYQQAKDAEAMAYEREQMAEQKRQFDMQQAAAKAQWDAQQKFQQDQFAASEEERLYNRRLQDEKEARRAPYRAASLDALNRLPDILASGRTSPGLGSLGSYRK